MTTLPSFKKPPLVEVVCGAQFEPLPLLAAHLGKFQPNGYVATQEHLPLANVVERLESNSPSIVPFATMVPPMARVWYENADGDKLPQVQSDRFLLNWRKTKEEHEYPRYEYVHEAFVSNLRNFSAFARESFGRELAHNQYELTYINHIMEKPEGNLLGSLSEYIPDLGWRTGPGRFLPAPETLSAGFAVRLPLDAGRLHIRIQSALRALDQRAVLILELTARGFRPDASEWFALAREWIVRGFCDLTNTGAQQHLWERTQ